MSITIDANSGALEQQWNCERCGRELLMVLRADGTFLSDKYHEVAGVVLCSHCYEKFIDVFQAYLDDPDFWDQKEALSRFMFAEDWTKGE